MSQSSTEEVTTTSSTLSFNEGTIHHVINVDKFSREAKEVFVIEVPATGEKHRIKKESIIEIARLSKKADQFNYLLGEGYEASGNMQAGAGKAIRMTKSTDSYNLVIFVGETGKSFDPKKVQCKTYVKLDKNYLNAIFTCVLEDEKVKEAKKVAKQLQRTSLELS